MVVVTVCPECGHMTPSNEPLCQKCGINIHVILAERKAQGLTEVGAGLNPVAPPDEGMAEEGGATEWQADGVVPSPGGGMPLSTASMIAGAEIGTEIGIVAAECVCGADAVRDLFVRARDAVGGGGVAARSVFKEARATCLAELRREAGTVGADAVIGVRLDYTELGGGEAPSMILLAASGTAVKLRR